MDMPILKPLPIPTKNCNILKRAWVWFSTIRQWEIMEDYTFLFEGLNFFIPKGFIFDGASVPRIFWSILAPTGLLLIPGLFHDHGYRFNYLLIKTPEGIRKYKEGAGKAFWDALFMRIGKEVNGVHFANTVAWMALTVGGWLAWWSGRNKTPPEGCPPFKDRGETLEN